jgi:hypothetical protein
MNERRGVLTAGGNAVHRLRRATEGATQEPSPDTVPIIERYQDVAAFMHKVSVAPRADRFLIGCVCGWYTLSPVGSSGKASMIAQQHVLDAADDMYRVLEPEPIEKGV